MSRYDAKSDAAPADEQPQEIVGHHQQQHREDEEVHVGEERAIVLGLGHVADGIQMDEEADARDDEHPHQRQRIDQQPERNR